MSFLTVSVEWLWLLLLLWMQITFPWAHLQQWGQEDEHTGVQDTQEVGGGAASAHSGVTETQPRLQATKWLQVCCYYIFSLHQGISLLGENPCGVYTTCVWMQTKEATLGCLHFSSAICVIIAMWTQYPHVVADTIVQGEGITPSSML